jgi:hypothetical protein
LGLGGGIKFFAVPVDIMDCFLDVLHQRLQSSLSRLAADQQAFLIPGVKCLLLNINSRMVICGGVNAVLTVGSNELTLDKIGAPEVVFAPVRRSLMLTVRILKVRKAVTRPAFGCFPDGAPVFDRIMQRDPLLRGR